MIGLWLTFTPFNAYTYGGAGAETFYLIDGGDFLADGGDRLVHS